jgi:adenylate kinase family enzyme
MPHPPIVPCRRWLILGSGGSGKSTFAREMAECLGLPVIHLDQHFWKAGWVEIDKSDWANKVTDLSASDAWIMDGNYGGTISRRLPRAECAVLLDPPVWTCLWGILRRALFFRGTTRPDIAEGCEERLPDWKFVWFVGTYKWRSRPRVLRRIAEAEHVTLYHLKGRRAARRFLEQLCREAPDGPRRSPSVPSSPQAGLARMA